MPVKYLPGVRENNRTMVASMQIHNRLFPGRQCVRSLMVPENSHGSTRAVDIDMLDMRPFNYASDQVNIFHAIMEPLELTARNQTRKAAD
jgi:hypothetical protein